MATYILKRRTFAVNPGMFANLEKSISNGATKISNGFSNSMNKIGNQWEKMGQSKIGKVGQAGLVAGGAGLGIAAMSGNNSND